MVLEGIRVDALPQSLRFLNVKNERDETNLSHHKSFEDQRGDHMGK